MPSVPEGSVHAHIMRTKPSSRVDAVVSRSKLVELGAATCVGPHGWAMHG